MEFKNRQILMCNCAQTMPLDGAAIGKAFAAITGETAVAPTIHHQLCRTQSDAYLRALGDGQPVLVACTQEAPIFRELADDIGSDTVKSFVNIRERAGWSKDTRFLPARIAALIAEATIDVAPAGLKTITSEGICLVYGKDEKALEAAKTLSGRLAVSVVISNRDHITPPDLGDMPVHTGQIVAAKGSLGQFEVTVDDYAPMLPSSRATAQFAMARNGAQSGCDLILDLSGGTPLFTGHEKRDGYFRADPSDRAAIAEAMFQMADLVGTFEKPIYVRYHADICAHGASGKTGCTRCLDACPAGAITSLGETLAFDAGICGGCGHCGAVCPTGAAAYDFPNQGDLIRRIQALLSAYLAAGGDQPCLLLHDDKHGAALIAALARHGDGLPGTVLPLSVHAVGEAGHGVLTAALTAGAAHIIILASQRKQDELAATQSQVELTEALLRQLDLDPGRVQLLLLDDPDQLAAALAGLADKTVLRAGTFEPVGNPRQLARSAITKLAENAAFNPDWISLPEAAPYGRLAIDADGCTLCLSCVGACPTSALGDNPDQPQLRFTQSACVQCGLCVATCPEHVIRLEPGFDFTEAAHKGAILVEEEPFCCTSCGKPFGTKRTIEKIQEKLAGKHPMFMTANAESVIGMCDDCRIAAMAARSDNPFAMGEAPRVRTTDDYLDARETVKKGLSVDDFLQDLED